MILHVLRALFILLMAAVAFFFAYQDPRPDLSVWLLPAVSLSAGVLLVCIDILTPRRKLAVFSGTLFGLVVGLFIAYVLSFVVRLIVVQWVEGDRERIVQFVDMMVAVACCYLSISFVLQSK